MTGNKLLVMLGYGEDFGLGVRCLCFRTEQMPTDEACEVVKIVKGYNAFDGQKVAKIIKKIAALWPSTYQQV